MSIHSLFKELNPQLQNVTKDDVNTLNEKVCIGVQFNLNIFN